MAGDTKAKIITPPSQLKDKVSVGGIGAVDAAAIERAERAIADLSDNYLEWAQEDLNKIQAAFAKLGAERTEERETSMHSIFSISHDMKGQGGSFGFDLVTAVGNHLCRLIERFDGTVKPQTENDAIRIHIDAMTLIIGNNMKGDGGSQGEAMLKGIQQMVAKLVPAG
jgi:chemotaxis protein histidine kinase CheA